MRRSPLVAILAALTTAPLAAVGFKFVSIGSDDWGRWSSHGPVWPDNATRQLFWDEGLWLSGGEPPRATAESLEDIHVLYDFIEALNTGVPRTHRAVLTPFWVVAGPDFDAMRMTGCPGQPSCEYRELWWHNSSGGLAQPPFERGDLRAAYREGFERGLWHPEYHGRSHFDTRAWTAYLSADDVVTSHYFNNGLTYYHYGRHNETSGSFHSTHSEYRSDDAQHQRPHDDMAEWIAHGVEAFADFWGYRATVTALPCHHGFDALGAPLAAAGISGVEGMASGRGLLPGLTNVSRVLFDPAFQTLGDEEAALRRAQQELSVQLEDGRHVAVQWHAANVVSATVSADQRALSVRLLWDLVAWLRTTYKEELVFVTASENAQIKQRGWSVEVWHRRVHLRNYSPHAVRLAVPAPARLDHPPPSAAHSASSHHPRLPNQPRDRYAAPVIPAVDAPALESPPPQGVSATEGRLLVVAGEAGVVAGAWSGRGGDNEGGPAQRSRAHEGERVAVGEHVELSPFSEAEVVFGDAGARGGEGAREPSRSRCPQRLGNGMALLSVTDVSGPDALQHVSFVWCIVRRVSRGRDGANWTAVEVRSSSATAVLPHLLARMLPLA